MNAIFKRGKPAFIPYVMAGDPDRETTALLLKTLAESGADAVELGVPYGDPLADGPTIAAAAVRALRTGTGIAQVLELAARAPAELPVILFTYFNPVYQYGIERFASDAREARVAAAIVPDIALEEGDELREALRQNGVLMPLLVAPSTPRERAALIARESSGFVYVVSRLGVTGAGEAPDFTPVRKQISELREVTDEPLAVGFGISKPEHVRAVRDAVDGIIVGSALIDSYAETRGEEAARRVREFVTSLKK